MTKTTIQDIRSAVGMAVRFWPNAHLGDNTTRQDIRSAFQMIRRRLDRGDHIQAAIGAVEASAYRHADM